MQLPFAFVVRSRSWTAKMSTIYKALCSTTLHLCDKYWAFVTNRFCRCHVFARSLPLQVHALHSSLVADQCAYYVNKPLWHRIIALFLGGASLHLYVLRASRVPGSILAVLPILLSWYIAWTWEKWRVREKSPRRQYLTLLLENTNGRTLFVRRNSRKWFHFLGNWNHNSGRGCGRQNSVSTQGGQSYLLRPNCLNFVDKRPTGSVLLLHLRCNWQWTAKDQAEAVWMAESRIDEMISLLWTESSWISI